MMDVKINRLLNIKRSSQKPLGFVAVSKISDIRVFDIQTNTVCRFTVKTYVTWYNNTVKFVSVRGNCSSEQEI